MRKVVVFISAPGAGEVRNAIVHSGAGRIGNYTSTVNHAHTGYSDAMNAMDEERIEFACDDATFADIMKAIKALSGGYTSVDSWNMDLLTR